MLDEITAVLGRQVRVAHTYRNVVNGLAVAVDAQEAAALAGLPGVSAVVPDQTLTLETDTSNGLIRSPAVWAGETAGQVATRGEGVIVGVLDTGINPGHPSFAAVDGDGYRHTNPYGAGNYVGVCAPNHPQHLAICNDKLIGAWAMIGTDPGTTTATAATPPRRRPATGTRRPSRSAPTSTPSPSPGSPRTPTSSPTRCA
nr:S8 family serine peptidase [Plantactinospora sp. KBS50]